MLRKEGFEASLGYIVIPNLKIRNRKRERRKLIDKHLSLTPRVLPKPFLIFSSLKWLSGWHFGDNMFFSHLCLINISCHEIVFCTSFCSQAQSVCFFLTFALEGFFWTSSQIFLPGFVSFLLFCVCVCVCMHILLCVCLCAKHLVRVCSFLPPCGFTVQPQVIELGDKCLYLMSHFCSLSSGFLKDRPRRMVMGDFIHCCVNSEKLSARLCRDCGTWVNAA